MLRDNPVLWDHFTRKEEYNSQYRDKFNRFTYYQSQSRDILEPSVSEYLIKKGYSPEYRGGTKFAVCLTHDIDLIYTSLLPRVKMILRSTSKKNNQAASVGIHGTINKKIPYCNFDSIIDLEEMFDAKSSFYFLAPNPGDQDCFYNIYDLKEELKDIYNRGWEVGLHGSLGASTSFERICDEKRRLEEVLGKSIVGYRSHFLKFCVPITWEYLAKAGFLYDTTLGYADCAGFRNGMCHPFIPFNLEKNSEINILEIPLIVMDNTLFHDYMRLDHKTALKVIKQIIDKVAENRGVFTLLWHNTFLVKGLPEREMYENILRYCSEKGAWMTSGEEIMRWYQNF